MTAILTFTSVTLPLWCQAHEWVYVLAIIVAMAIVGIFIRIDGKKCKYL